MLYIFTDSFLAIPFQISDVRFQIEMNRPRRYYRITPAGERALENSWQALKSMWEGLKPGVRRT